jgi:hypothetical protein
MTPSPNIDYLLLGMVPRPDGTRFAFDGDISDGTSASLADGVGPLLFGDILGLITGHGGLSAVDPDITSHDDSLSGSRSALDFQALTHAIMNLPTENPALDIEKAPRGFTSDLPNKADILPSTTVADPDIVEWPGASLVRNSVQQNWSESVPVDIEPGKYDILSSRLTNGRLELVIRPQSDSHHQIQLSLPADALTVTAGGRARIPVAHSGSRHALDGLLMQNRVQSIEITDVSRVHSKSVDQPQYDIRIITDDTASRAAISARLQRTELHASEYLVGLNPDKPDTNARSKPVDIDQCTDKNTSLHTENRSEPIPKVALNSGDEETASDPWRRNHDTSLLDQLGTRELSDRYADDRLNFHIDHALSQRTHGSPNVDGKPIPPVRFVLPEGTSHLLKSSSQSIMLRIEPDHLGPARLNLTMRGDALTARVTVETPHAHAAVEASLDHLSEQLGRAGIKVQQIEVSLDGGALADQFADSRAAWHRPKFSNQTYINNTLNTDRNYAPDPLTRYAGQYIGTQGVNLFA